MSNTTIRETVEANIGNRSYLSYAGSTISALEQREQGIKDRAAEVIREAARSQGLNSGRVEQVLIDAGLVERAPEPTATESSDQGGAVAALAQQVQRIADRLDRAAAQAARHGIRF